MDTYPDVNSAYCDVLLKIAEGGIMVPPVISSTSITSGFGEKPRGFRELVGHSFVVTNPRARQVVAKQIDVRFAIANFLWMMSGQDDHAWIGRFNSKGAGLAEVDGHYPGAHGRRIGPQLRRVVSLLREDPYTRRADLIIARDEDVFTHSRDIPCVFALQFLRRPGPNGRDVLNLVCHMRSQNTANVFPYDFYAFTMLQEMVACALWVELGAYTHQVGSLHIFESDMTLVDEIASGTRTVAQSPVMAEMPHFGDMERIVSYLMNAEEMLATSNGLRTIHPYWTDMVNNLRQD